MASGKEYLMFILEQLPPEDISFRPMMGEYILYYRGKVFGGIYDDRLLVKNTPASRRLLPDAPMEYPYEGGSKMVLIEEMENRQLLSDLLSAMYPELPAPKRKK